MNADRIALEQLEIDCVVGVYPHERNRKQPLRVDIRLHLDTRLAGELEQLSHTVDYAETVNQVAFVLRSCRFAMLETAARTLTRLLLAHPSPAGRGARVHAVELCLTKPYALSGHGIPSLTVFRQAEEVALARREHDYGAVDVVDETRRAGVYLLHLAPGQAVPNHLHKQRREYAMMLGAGLECQTLKAEVGATYTFAPHVAHHFCNPTRAWQSVLCVQTPPRAPDDVFPADGPPARVRPEPPIVSRPAGKT